MNFFFELEPWLRTKLTQDERGANMVEYILLIALIVLAAIGAVVFLRTSIVDVLYEPSASTLSNL